MAGIEMKDVREMRKLIREGFSVKDVAEAYKVSHATVRNYTKGVKKRVEELAKKTN